MANIFGTDSAAKAVAFEEQAPGDFDDWKAGDNIGAHVLLTVKGIEEVDTNNYGKREAARHDVAVYNEKGEVVETADDILTFSAAIVRDLKKYVGQQVFARIGQYKSKYGRMAPCLEAPDAAYLDAYNKAA